MAQDPAQLFYYKDYLVSTAGWEAYERGWYINLLAHQMDKPEGLDNDIEKLAQLAGVKFSEFEKFVECWKRTLVALFVTNADNKLENKKLKDVISKRESYTDKQSLRGIVGAYVKRAKQQELFDEKQLKAFSSKLMNEFTSNQTKEEKEEIFNNVLKAYASSIYANANGNVNINGLKEEGLGETNLGNDAFATKKFIIPSMLQEWCFQQPDYLKDEETDFKALGEINRIIQRHENITNDPFADSPEGERLLASWIGIVKHVTNHKFFNKYSIKQVSNNFQAIVQDMIVSSKEQPQNKTSKEQGIYDAAQEAKELLKNQYQSHDASSNSHTEGKI